MTLGQFGQRIEGIVGIDLLPDDRLEARHRFAAPRENHALAFLYLVDDFLGMMPKIEHGNRFHGSLAGE